MYVSAFALNGSLPRDAGTTIREGSLSGEYADNCGSGDRILDTGTVQPMAALRIDRVVRAGAGCRGYSGAKWQTSAHLHRFLPILECGGTSSFGSSDRDLAGTLQHRALSWHGSSAADLVSAWVSGSDCAGFPDWVRLRDSRPVDLDCVVRTCNRGRLASDAEAGSVPLGGAGRRTGLAY